MDVANLSCASIVTFTQQTNLVDKCIVAIDIDG